MTFFSVEIFYRIRDTVGTYGRTIFFVARPKCFCCRRSSFSLKITKNLSPVLNGPNNVARPYIRPSCTPFLELCLIRPTSSQKFIIIQNGKFRTRIWFPGLSCLWLAFCGNFWLVQIGLTIRRNALYFRCSWRLAGIFNFMRTNGHFENKQKMLNWCFVRSSWRMNLKYGLKKSLHPPIKGRARFSVACPKKILSL